MFNFTRVTRNLVTVKLTNGEQMTFSSDQFCCMATSGPEVMLYLNGGTMWRLAETQDDVIAALAGDAPLSD